MNVDVKVRPSTGDFSVEAKPSRQHVSDAAYDRMGLNENVYSRLWLSGELKRADCMLITVEEHDEQACQIEMQKSIAATWKGFCEEWAKVCNERDALIRELQEQLRKGVMPNVPGPSANEPGRAHAVTGAAHRQNAGVLLLNLPEQRPQFGRGNDEQ